MFVDMPLEQLRAYQPALTREADFDAFWDEALRESAAQPLAVEMQPIAYPVERVRVARVSYAGFGPDTRIAGWWIAATELRDDLPTLVHFHGYSNSKGIPADYLHWALQGMRVFAVDVRGQDGDTPDNARYPSGYFIGHMTKGISDPRAYYYRNVYLDCARAVEVARGQISGGSIALTGRSQGGGLTIAAAALAGGPDVVAAMPDVPYLTHFRRSVEMFANGPYQELVEHWQRHPQDVERDFRTLSYCDAMNLSPRVTCPTLMSVGLLDDICPPSTAFAAFHHLGTTRKEIAIYPFNGHEGGGMQHEEVKYRFLRDVMAD